MNSTDKTYLRHALIAAMLVFLAAPTFAFRMIQANQQGFTTNGDPVTCDDSGGFAHWNTREIWWSRNVQGFGAQASSAIQAARYEWGSESDFTLRGGGTTTAFFELDNINTTIWEDNIFCGDGCLAITALVLGPDQEILEADIAFRVTGVRWRTDGRNWRRDRDVQAVATHEFGHALGLHHTEALGSPVPTMWPFYDDYRLGGRSIENDERNALACINQHYPVAGPGCTNAPAMPSGISGPTYSHCAGATANFTTNAVAAADTYRWEVVGTSWNRTTTSPVVGLTADFGTGTYTFRVRAENACGVSPWRNSVLVVHSSGSGPCF